MALYHFCAQFMELPGNSRLGASVLYLLHGKTKVVVRGQRIWRFCDDFFAKRGVVWCNRPNFPKGGWPGSLVES